MPMAAALVGAHENREYLLEREIAEGDDGAEDKLAEDHKTGRSGFKAEYLVDGTCDYAPVAGGDGGCGTRTGRDGDIAPGVGMQSLVRQKIRDERRNQANRQCD